MWIEDFRDIDGDIIRLIADQAAHRILRDKLTRIRRYERVPLQRHAHTLMVFVETLDPQTKAMIESLSMLTTVRILCCCETSAAVASRGVDPWVAHHFDAWFAGDTAIEPLLRLCFEADCDRQTLPHSVVPLAALIGAGVCKIQRIRLPLRDIRKMATRPLADIDLQILSASHLVCLVRGGEDRHAAMDAVALLLQTAGSVAAIPMLASAQSVGNAATSCIYFYSSTAKRPV